MNILFIHQNLPAQFKHLIRHYSASAEHRVVGMCQGYAPALDDPDCATTAMRVYAPRRKPTRGIHNYLYSLEAGVLNGQAVAAELHRLGKEGFTPDVTFVHPGWGEALYIKDVFPGRPLVGFFEFFYNAHDLDADFDPEFPLKKDEELRIRTRNALHFLSLDACDAGISPTHWQKSVHPAEYHHKLTVMHEGIPTQEIAPDPAATFTLPTGTVLTHDMEVITFAARSLEPYRGFHVFMRAVPEICRRRPNCHIVITGGDDVSYGRKLPDGETWRAKMLNEVDVDPNRVHFLGAVSWETHVTLLKVSTAHVYLTVPFVLSWSMLEAMSAGCIVVGSDTPPVREVISDGKNGLLVDFFSTEHLADALDDIFDHPTRRKSLAKAARKTIVSRYDVRDALTRYDKFFNDVSGLSSSVGRSVASYDRRRPAPPPTQQV